MTVRQRFVQPLVLAGLIAAGFTPGRAAPVRFSGVCMASGPLIVTETNEVRFHASGSCGPFSVTIFDDLGPFQDSYPTWTGGCGYGPGPFPKLRIVIYIGDPSGVLSQGYLTFWTFPETVVGAHRAALPNSTTRVLINDVVDDPYGRPSATGPQTGSGVLLTRIGGSCDVRTPSKSNATVVFALNGTNG